MADPTDPGETKPETAHTPGDESTTNANDARDPNDSTFDNTHSPGDDPTIDDNMAGDSEDQPVLPLDEFPPIDGDDNMSEPPDSAASSGAPASSTADGDEIMADALPTTEGPDAPVEATGGSDGSLPPEITAGDTPVKPVDTPQKRSPNASPGSSTHTTSRPLNFGNSILGGKTTSGKPKSDDEARQKLLDRQRAMAARFSKKNDGEPPVAPSNASDQGDDSENVTGDEAEKAAKALEQHQLKVAEFEHLRKIYERKKRAGTNSIEDDINFFKAESKEKVRLRKFQLDADFDKSPERDGEEDGLFVEPTAQPQAFSLMYSDEESETSKPKTTKRAPRKRKAQNAADDDDANGDQPRKKSKANTGAAKKRGRPKGPEHDYTEEEFQAILDGTIPKSRPKKNGKNAAGKGVAGKAAASKSKAKKSGGRDLLNTNNLFGSNVFNDTEQTKEMRNQPTFENTRRRNDAFKQLIASLPEEDRRVGHSDKRALDAAIRDFTGQRSVEAKDSGWLVKGMKTPLKHYQVLGVAFMRRRENSEQEPKGGILADQMGLGKTLQTLANIVNGKPAEKAKNRATLIVAAPALVSQWKSEISLHCLTGKENNRHGITKIIEYRSGSRMEASNLEQVLSEADVVLTTYHEVARSYPKAIVPPNLTTAAQKDAWWREYYEENKGVFHRIKFHRIVIDEAQAIKNHRGHTSMAVRAIDAKFHWALTGTPIMNSVKEFYPYFKFLREPHTGSYKIFKENFCTPDDPDGIDRLTIFLRKFMIRRTHVDTLFNARLLDLPQPREHTLWLEFNEVERTIYEIVKSRMIARINSMSKTEGLEKNYSHVWTMILRLRQLCGHILLIQGTIIDILEREDFEKLNRITTRENEMSEESARTLVHLRHVLANNHGVKNINAGVGDAVVTSSEVLPAGIVDIDEAQEETLGGTHGLSYHFRKYMSNLMESEKWDAIEERARCCSCRQKPYEPVVTSCFHIYCSKCVDALQHTAARRGHDSARCSECGEEFSSVEKVVEMEEFMDEKTVIDSEAGTENGKKGKKGKGKKREKKGPDHGMEDWIGMKGEILPSAKTNACKAQIQNWLDERPDCKIIVYSQFLPIIRILAKVCQTEGWSAIKYTGEMSHDARTRAIQDFADGDKKIKIMLASLRCGGLGLNLTMASRVICFDPWWNESVEQQAFCRVFRIGQTEETRMTRFVVKNTIDAAMMAMKERKQIEIDQVMNSKKDRVDVKDLMRLFGRVEEDAEGRPFIFAEPEPDDEERYRLGDSEDEDNFMGNDA